MPSISIIRSQSSREPMPVDLIHASQFPSPLRRWGRMAKWAGAGHSPHPGRQAPVQPAGEAPADSFLPRAGLAARDRV